MREWNIEDLPITVESVLRGQGADPEIMKLRSPRLFSIAEKALDEGVKLLKPAVLYRQLQVEEARHGQLILEDNFKISGEIVSQHLVSVQSIIAIICTVGPELENYASRVSDSDLVYGLALDGVGSAGVETLANAVCNYFEQESLKNGLQTTIPLSPGMIGWPVENGQPILFEILRPGKIGVELNPQFMMLPRKTVSILIGVGKELDNSKNPCDYCAMNGTCRYKNQYGQRSNK
ncbi:MAG: hypothetical protein IMZ53_05070 [Thermoplasmata archaeon]|nr:hypothetical protein [Thermoplasmata archaeon]